MNIFDMPDFSGKGPTNCKNYEDPDLFFPEPFEKGAGVISRKAKKVCSGCPYQLECAEWAFKNNEPGVWGGLSENERRSIKKGNKVALTLQTMRQNQSIHFR